MICNKKRLVLFAHGSSDPRWRAPFERLYRELQQELGREHVALAYMEFVSPTLREVAERALKEEVTTLVLLPLFMAAGGHVAADIPKQIQEIQACNCSLHVEVLPPIGEDARVQSLLKTIATEALALAVACQPKFPGTGT
jgi:sirohydrochlorin cobaltochelatase